MKRLLLAVLMGLLVGTCALATDYKSLIGVQDINWGTGTFDRKTSTGSTITLDKVDSSKVPLKSAPNYYVDDLFDGAWGLTIYPSTITGSGAGTISGFSSITGTQGIFTTDNITTANITTGIVTTDNITTANIATLNVTGTPTFADNTVNGADLTDNTVLPSKVRYLGVLAYKSADQSITYSSEILLTWDSESYDTSAIHSVSADTGLLTVPVGVSKVRVSAHIRFYLNGTGTRMVEILKNGSAAYVGFSVVTTTGVADFYGCVYVSTPVLDVTAGDYFSVYAFQSSGGPLAVIGDVGGSWFSMEIIQ